VSLAKDDGSGVIPADVTHTKRCTEMTNKTKHNFWLDVIIFVSLLITTSTGFLLWLVIPHQLNVAFLGFASSVWIATHICFGVAGLTSIVMHIVLHWDWLKALRGRSLRGMPEKLRANRVVDRIIWIAFIATNVFGVMAWALHFGDDVYAVSFTDRLHVVFGIAWTIFAIVHLVLHWKWIASTSQRYVALGLGRSIQ